MNLKLNTNLVRIFNGTYNTIWEIIEYDEAGENQVEVEYEAVDLVKSIANVYQSQSENILTDLDIPFIKSIKFTGETWSPREYNFSTDQLDFIINIDKRELVKTVKGLKDSKEFTEFLIDNYRSQDGFISFTPDNYAEIRDSILNQRKDMKQSLGALITFLAGDKFYEIEQWVWDYWQGNGYGGLDYKVVDS